MGACQTVTQWITANVLMPVTQFLTAVQEVCDEVGQWVDEQVEQPVEQQISQAQEQCSDWPWPLDWVCDLVMVVVTVIVWVVVTVAKWVVTLVCQIVTIVVGIVVTFILQVIAWAISFVVCLFTDPLAALASFRDLWTIITDTIGRVFDFADTLLADIDGILGDVEDLIDSVASAFGWLGTILGLLKGIIHWIRDIVSGVRDAIRGVKDLVIGILSGNLCRIIRGGLDLGTSVGRLGFDVGFGVPIWAGIRAGGAAIGGFRDEIDQHQLEGVIRDALANAFGADTERINRAIRNIGINIRPMGLPFHLDARRMFLDSENATFNPKILHDGGVINLYRLAGYWSDCGKLNNEPDTEVVYAGTNLHVTYADIDTYLRSGPGSTPHFRAYAITRSKFRTHLEMAQRKMQALGVRLFYQLGEVEANSSDHLPLNVTEGDSTATPPIPASNIVQQNLFASIDGRDASGTGLSTIPTVSHFHYIRVGGRELFGLTTWFRPPDQEISGVTYRNLTPDWGLRFVLSHELGHYLGLNHVDRAGNDRPLDQIMYSPRNGINVAWTTPFEYLLLEGEPRFTLDDARTVWDWITGPAVRNILLP